jgi:hypothetical protein
VDMAVKFDLFVLALILMPVLVDFVPAVQRPLLAWSEKKVLSPAAISVGAGLIFVHDFSNPVVSLLSLVVGFILFFLGFAVAIACLKSRTDKAL